MRFFVRNFLFVYFCCFYSIHFLGAVNEYFCVRYIAFATFFDFNFADLSLFSSLFLSFSSSTIARLFHWLFFYCTTWIGFLYKRVSMDLIFRRWIHSIQCLIPKLSNRNATMYERKKRYCCTRRIGKYLMLSFTEILPYLPFKPIPCIFQVCKQTWKFISLNLQRGILPF